MNGHHDTRAGGVACRTVVRKTLLDGDSDLAVLERDLSVQLLGFLLSLVELSNGLGAVLDARDGLELLVDLVGAGEGEVGLGLGAVDW